MENGRVQVLVLSAIALLTCCLSGCSESDPILFPVTGRILYKNEPIPKARMVFHPQFQGPGWMPAAVVEEDGSFEASTKLPGDGVLEGRYIVTVVWQTSEDDYAPNLLPARYADPKTSKLEITAGPDSADLPTIYLTEKPQ